MHVNYILTKADETFHTKLFSVSVQQIQCLQNVQSLLHRFSLSWKAIKSPTEKQPFLITSKCIPLIFVCVCFISLLVITFENLKSKLSTLNALQMKYFKRPSKLDFFPHQLSIGKFLSFQIVTVSLNYLNY